MNLYVYEWYIGRKPSVMLTGCAFALISEKTKTKAAERLKKECFKEDSVKNLIKGIICVRKHITTNEAKVWFCEGGEFPNAMHPIFYPYS